MSKPKQQPHDMDNDTLKARYFRLKGRCDWINKWMPRLCGGLAAAAVITAGVLLVAGTGGAAMVFACGVSGACLPLTFTSMARDGYADEMSQLSSENNGRLIVAEAQEKRALAKSLRDLQDQFNAMADGKCIGKGIDKDVVVKGPLKLTRRIQSFTRA